MSWDAVFGALVALGAVWFDRWLSSRTERGQSVAVRDRHLAALSAEIDYCAKLAHVYFTENILAPLYRFPRTVYDTVYPTLVSDTLDETDISALTSFYSQVDQMNRGLDAIAKLVPGGITKEMQIEGNRLRAKAEEMRHPTEALQRPPGGSEFYHRAIAALQRPRN